MVFNVQRKFGYVLDWLSESGGVVCKPTYCTTYCACRLHILGHHMLLCFFPAPLASVLAALTACIACCYHVLVLLQHIGYTMRCYCYWMLDAQPTTTAVALDAQHLLFYTIYISHFYCTLDASNADVTTKLLRIHGSFCAGCITCWCALNAQHLLLDGCTTFVTH